MPARSRFSSYTAIFVFLIMFSYFIGSMSINGLIDSPNQLKKIKSDSSEIITPKENADEKAPPDWFDYINEFTVALAFGIPFTVLVIILIIRAFRKEKALRAQQASNIEEEIIFDLELSSEVLDREKEEENGKTIEFGFGAVIFFFILVFSLIFAATYGLRFNSIKSVVLSAFTPRETLLVIILAFISILILSGLYYVWFRASAAVIAGDELLNNGKSQ